MQLKFEYPNPKSLAQTWTTLAPKSSGHVAPGQAETISNDKKLEIQNKEKEIEKL
jgi:hypothetical protein